MAALDLSGPRAATWPPVSSLSAAVGRPAPDAPAQPVTVYRADTDEEIVRAALVLRVGTMDERLAEAGLLEVLLRQALPVETPADVSISASIGFATTYLSLAGDPATVPALLQQIADALADPAPDAVDTVLAEFRDQESARPSDFDIALLDRYGAQGPGLAAFPRFGLTGVTAASVRDAAARFVRHGNARLVVLAPADAVVRVTLPEGDRVPAVDPVAPPQYYPRGYPLSGSGSLLALGEVDRSAAAVALASLWAGDVYAAVRDAQGVAYSPQSVYIPLVSTALLGVRSDTTPAPALRSCAR